MPHDVLLLCFALRADSKQRCQNNFAAAAENNSALCSSGATQLNPVGNMFVKLLKRSCYTELLTTACARTVQQQQPAERAVQPFLRENMKLRRASIVPQSFQSTQRIRNTIKRIQKSQKRIRHTIKRIRKPTKRIRKYFKTDT